MRELDDNELLREYAGRNSEAAFATLVARHINQVYSVALRHGGNPGQAEEITQAVFVILARKAGRLRPDTILSAWLHQTARLTAVTLMRGEIRRARREHEAHMQTLSDQTESDDSWKQMSPLLDGAIAELGPKDRAAIVLRFFDGKSMKEVGAALSASEDAAKKRVDRTVEKLRRCLTKRGVVFPAAVLAAALAAHSVQAASAALTASVSAAAIAKGATVSASTLTLIKGTLKLIAWAKMKTTIIAGAVTLLAAGFATLAFSGGSPAAGGEPNAAVAMADRLLHNPPRIIDCTYSDKKWTGNDPLGNPQYTNEYWRVGVYGSNFYALRFRSSEDTDNSANVVEGHGWNDGVQWRISNGILIETNAPDDGWMNFAVLPLKLGIAPLIPGRVTFDSSTSFHTTDFAGAKLSGHLSPNGRPNGCIISYHLEGATNSPNWNVTVTWPMAVLSGTEPALPQRIVNEAGGLIIDEQEISGWLFAGDGAPPPDFSPEKIGDWHLPSKKVDQHLKIISRVRNGVVLK